MNAQDACRRSTGTLKVTISKGGLVNLETNPQFQVKMFLNMQCPYRNGESEPALLRKFTNTFCQDI